MSNGARQFPETGDFAPFCANRFCADGLFYFHVELFRCAGESPLQRRPKGMKTNEVCDRPLETFGAATFGVICGLNLLLQGGRVIPADAPIPLA